MAKLYGVSLSQLAKWLGRSRQTLTKTPHADSLQGDLSYFERIARLHLVLGNSNFRKWLRLMHAIESDFFCMACARGQTKAMKSTTSAE